MPDELHVWQARVRTLRNGKVFEEDVITCPAEVWAAALDRAPSLANWRVAEFPDGLVVALEPLAAVLGRLREHVAARA